MGGRLTKHDLEAYIEKTVLIKKDLSMAAKGADCPPFKHLMPMLSA